MTYTGVIYFAGSKSRWAGRIDSTEIIYRFSAASLSLTRAHLLSTFILLDNTRCGWALLRDGECIEQFDPPIPEPVIPEAA